jgi:very-short-patch-repair endonuclease
MQDHTSHSLKSARRLRKTMTLPEILLWQHLRGKPGGVKFRHQHPVLGYVLDFYCASKRVAIEIDGIAHDMGIAPSHDAKRDLALKHMGIDVVRISAADVLKDALAVADLIVRLCAHRPPPSALRAATSPRGGGNTGAPQ